MSEVTPEFPFKSILIYGMGMMGASLALALKSCASFRGRLDAGVRTEKSAAVIREKKLADRLFIAGEKIPLHDYDLIVLGMPVKSIVQLISEMPVLPGIVTDMSSTRSVVNEAVAGRPDLRFVGSHPMCGSEDTGPQAARVDLFKKRLCIMMQNSQGTAATEADLNAVETFWKALGMATCRMDPQAHDVLLGYLSHTPHILSGILTLWAMDNPVVINALKNAPLPITGGGFKDMARIAGSNPEMWADILETNRENIILALEDFGEKIKKTAEHLKNGERKWWMNWFHEARVARNRLCGFPEDR